jgi:hypothetical protein
MYNTTLSNHLEFLDQMFVPMSEQGYQECQTESRTPLPGGNSPLQHPPLPCNPEEKREKRTSADQPISYRQTQYAPGTRPMPVPGVFSPAQNKDQSKKTPLQRGLDDLPTWPAPSFLPQPDKRPQYTVGLCGRPPMDDFEPPFLLRDEQHDSMPLVGYPSPSIEDSQCMVEEISPQWKNLYEKEQQQFNNNNKDQPPTLVLTNNRPSETTNAFMEVKPHDFPVISPEGFRKTFHDMSWDVAHWDDIPLCQKDKLCYLFGHQERPVYLSITFVSVLAAFLLTLTIIYCIQRKHR